MTDATTPVPRGRILVVDDQRNMRATTAMLLRDDGYTVSEAATGEEALGVLAKGQVDLLLTDLKMEPMDGLTLLKRGLEVSPRLQAIMMTAFGSIESAVEAMRLGAYDYVTKPFKEGELRYRVERALERSKLQMAVDNFATEFYQTHGLSALVGRSQAMRELTTRLMRVAQSDATVLIQGESGTGKELVARALHAHSRRSGRPFVPVNCAAISETLLESELFGHAKGAFTGAVKTRRGLFEEADGGTLFIDEVTETSPAFQSKLLRTLQDGEVRRVGESTAMRVDARIAAATNRDIELEVREKRFRQDLYYRLNVVMLRVPPLRERLDDVPALAEHFLQRSNARSPRARRLSATALEHLMTYNFPGNVRELENLVEQAAALAEADELLPEDFPLRPQSRVLPAAASGLPPTDARPGSPEASGPTLAEVVEEAERRAIVQALERHGVDLARVADELGVSSTTLWRKMKRLNLRPPAGAPRE
ncbi:sigma-54-dependent Fis family transcriptional regulator [Corallococcus praedator]|uniref:Sigma-54-dependent Fis family transcriptional regulator n=1 Tax=Corallococcus praedator TaxID=2316724 RepID=A0ABX9QB64_9BACT|nr:MULTISPECIES: sigma-54 dependent transcriptional regulator [Corallococcus]RKH11719.1 sigma-54-dependent Fis family transcriptional regulator [Corallococcus sp. CA047B]RKH26709.1 sigma-54-dependent Fis family transcriptional regulator [Corallococcus sp. CA031C]RKH95895.1 sigma-54-dependent Fis family transcriptional regulator [Corallococcus praedator]